MNKKIHEAHIGDDGIVEDIGPVLTHPEVFMEPGFLERHKLLVAAIGGGALALIGAGSGAVVSRHRHNTQMA